VAVERGQLAAPAGLAGALEVAETGGLTGGEDDCPMVGLRLEVGLVAMVGLGLMLMVGCAVARLADGAGLELTIALGGGLGLTGVAVGVA
jgi:hypothetical protein